MRKRKRECVMPKGRTEKEMSSKKQKRERKKSEASADAEREDKQTNKGWENRAGT